MLSYSDNDYLMHVEPSNNVAEMSCLFVGHL